MNRIRRYTQRQSRQVDFLYKHGAKYTPDGMVLPK